METNLKMVESDMTTILESDAEFEGKLTFDATAQVNGKFRGEIFSDGTLIVGDGAQIEGQVNVGIIIASGSIEGEIRAKQRIELLSTAKVTGNMHSPALVVNEGAVFEGHCHMGVQFQEAPKIENNKNTESKLTESSSTESGLTGSGLFDIANISSS